jgi:hypothetical protein
MNIKKALITATAVGVLLGACANDNASTDKERDVAKEQLKGFLVNQPIPVFNWSQLRQNLIELETAQANTTATTTFFFNQGVVDPIMSCPSIGFPIPASYQLTSPDQVYDTSRDNGVTVAQIESTGVYTAGSTGTYVICVGGDGKAFASYWEGFVQTVSGPAKWVDGHVQMTGPSSVDFTTSEG